MLTELILALSAIGFLAFLILYVYVSKKTEGQEKQTNVSLLLPKEKRGFRYKFSILAQKYYPIFVRTPILRGLVRNVRVRLETINTYDEYKIRREVMKIILIALSISALIVLVCSLFNQSILYLCIVLIAVIFLNGVLIDMFVHRLEDRLLKQFKDFLSDVRHSFQQYKMIDTAIYEATKQAQYEMKLQGDRIYQILDSTNPHDKLSEYESVAPNRFLKAFASICVLVLEKGDVRNADGSVFLNGLSGLTQELNYEILHRARLAQIFKGLSVVTVIPIIFTLPIRQWAVSYFPSMIAFYDSRIGLISQLILYFVIITAYVLIRKMREVNEAKYTARIKRKLLSERLYNIKPITYVVDAFTPKYYQKDYFKLTRLIKQANSPTTLEWLTTQRIMVSILTFLFIVGAFIFSNYSISQHALYSPTTNVLMGKLTEEERIAAEQRTDFDREVILHFKGVKDKTYEDIVTYVTENLESESGQASEITVTADRIYKKIQTVESSYFKWWELLIAVFGTVVAYYSPVWLLHFQAFLRKMDMEEEVNQFYTIISVVSHFESVSAQNVLEWMERFAVIFKEPLKKCLLNYDSGPDEALEELKEDVSFLPFSRLVDRLTVAVQRISVKDSFDDIDLEKQFYVEQRNRYNDNVLNNKKTWGEIISFASIHTLIFLYLVIPMLYISITNAANMMKQFL